MPSSVTRYRLSVEPEVLEAVAVIDAVDHRCQTLEVWLAAMRGVGVEQDRTGVVLDQLPLNFPDDLFALLGVGLGRLLVDQLVHLGIAKAGIIARRAAHIILVE